MSQIDEQSADDEDVFNFKHVIPRRRSDYSTTGHMMERIRMDGRFVTEGLVREVIADGEIRGNTPGRGGWLFAKEYDGVEVKLVCDIGPDLESQIITGLSTVVDRKAAINSDRWGKHMVQKVELRKEMSSGANKISRETMEGLVCPTAIDMKGHRVLTARGWDHLKCVNCSIQTRSKSELAGTPCE